MKILDRTLLINASFVRLFAYNAVIQVPIFLFIYAFFNISNEELYSGIVERWREQLFPALMVLVFMVGAAIFDRRLHKIEIRGKDSLTPSVLKGANNRKIDLSKNYAIKISKRYLTLSQEKNKITIAKFVYTNSDFERLLSILKI